jgi:hypothetical protein
LDSDFPPPMCSQNPQQLNFFKWESPLYTCTLSAAETILQ